MTADESAGGEPADDKATVDELPEITKIEYPTRVGLGGNPAVVIWFANDTALRYVWDGDQIQEQAYVDGVVQSSYGVGGTREELSEYGLMSVAEYESELQDDPEACKFDWGHIYEMLIQ